MRLNPMQTAKFYTDKYHRYDVEPIPILISIVENFLEDFFVNVFVRRASAAAGRKNSGGQCQCTNKYQKLFHFHILQK